eukprot:COSAG05_NODE_774_length_7437_cov_53.159853_3_plen_751_part_00
MIQLLLLLLPLSTLMPCCCFSQSVAAAAAGPTTPISTRGLSESSNWTEQAVHTAGCSKEQGQKLAQEFCRTPVLNPPGCADADWLALRSGPGSLEWRCYSPTVLNANHTAYEAGNDYCTENKQILQILQTCKLPPPPPPPVGDAVFTPGMKLHSNGEEETIHTFRIPSLLRVGKTNILLAFAEGRKFSSSDFGPKALCIRRSLDLGVSWQKLTAIVNHGNASFMNPNAIWDDRAKVVILQFTYTQCNLDCKGANCCDNKFLGHAAPSLFQIVSTDAGKTFSEPVSLDVQLGFPGLAMGPGIGIQLPTGRLLAMGWGSASEDLFSGHDVVIASDSSGTHWRTTHIFNGTDGVGLDEPQLALLPNGNVMANMRTSNTRHTCRCRAVSVSTDSGESFGAVESDSNLISPVCQGSILAGKRSVWFSNPANAAARADFTVRKSKDNAHTWGQSKLVSAAAGCGYTSLQFLEAINESKVGFLWEADTHCTIRFVPVTLKTDDRTHAAPHAVGYNPLRDLAPLRLVHYGWPFPNKVYNPQHIDFYTSNPGFIDGVMIDYVRITGACPINIPEIATLPAGCGKPAGCAAYSNLEALKNVTLACIKLCRTVQQARLAAAAPPAALNLVLSPWMNPNVWPAGAAGADPTLSGVIEQRYMANMTLALKTVAALALAHNVTVAATIFDSERFLLRTPAQCNSTRLREAITRKHDLLFNASLAVFPQAAIYRSVISTCTRVLSLPPPLLTRRISCARAVYNIY